MYISSLSQKALGKENGTVDYSSRFFHVLPLPPWLLLLLLLPTGTIILVPPTSL